MCVTRRTAHVSCAPPSPLFTRLWLTNGTPFVHTVCSHVCVALHACCMRADPFVHTYVWLTRSRPQQAQPGGSSYLSATCSNGPASLLPSLSHSSGAPTPQSTRTCPTLWTRSLPDPGPWLRWSLSSPPSTSSLQSYSGCATETTYPLISLTCERSWSGPSFSFTSPPSCSSSTARSGSTGTLPTSSPSSP